MILSLAHGNRCSVPKGTPIIWAPGAQKAQRKSGLKGPLLDQKGSLLKGVNNGIGDPETPVWNWRYHEWSLPWFTTLHVCPSSVELKHMVSALRDSYCTTSPRVSPMFTCDTNQSFRQLHIIFMEVIAQNEHWSNGCNEVFRLRCRK